MDTAPISRPAPPLLSRLAAASPWSRGRIAGEAVLLLVLAGIAGTMYGAESGSAASGGAVALLVALLSLVRRSLPATVLLASSVLAGSVLGCGPLLIYASWSAGSRIRRPWRAVGAYAAGLVLYVVPALLADGGEGIPGLSLLMTAVLGGGPYLALAVVPGLASRYRAQRRDLLEALRRHNAQLVREQAMVARQARLLERQRIAQDMHDSLGHQLALIAVHAGALEVDPGLGDRQREGVGILREAARSAMRELREAVGILRDDTEEPPAPAPGPEPEAAGAPHERGAAGVDALVASSRSAGAPVELRRSGERRPLAAAADHAVYRIVQEGLTNAHKHAPGAPITVELRYEPDSLVVEVANAPVPEGAPSGPPAISGGQGLAGLEERARLVGGMVHSGPSPDGGFRLAGVLPYGDGASPVGREDATSVAAERDVRGQIPAGAAGDGGADMNRSDPKEYAAIMSSKKNVALGCALVSVVLVAGVGALLVWGVNKAIDEVEKGIIPAYVYEDARIGDAEAELRKQFPEGDSLLTDGVEKQGPPLPQDAVCEHYVDDEADIVYRFCFRDGKLVAKESYPHEI
ncbi:signal transduction histidine kinase [Streptomyces thermodiastaticus]|uniref:histidine kinase n=1 Tax=Streptomyces thermodiastaticus TaxID=44061 RepID=A0ABU0KP70_9ACTN|nr:signal transduction histidine kinase [Streptomyces thermodiastaticus]UVT09112.1 two-component sensor histidine kinase [Streptomyces thermocarboxydus]WSB40756.1 histidine kinase [Streptomyces cellulosae]WTF19760.1 histidine kinase [Streptomyces cellulosae]